jgi:hypothetical protein
MNLLFPNTNTIITPINTQNIHYAQNNKRISLESKDTMAVYEMSENLQLLKAYTGGAEIYQGDINGKSTIYKRVFNSKDTLKCEADIANKKLLMEINFISKNIVQANGEYNNKNFQLNIEKNKTNDYVTRISGKINDKDIDINLNGADVPKDEDTRDIITSILVSNLNSPFIINGKIEKVVMSPLADDIINNNLSKKEKNFDRFGVPLIAGGLGILTAQIPKLFSFIIKHLPKK